MYNTEEIMALYMNEESIANTARRYCEKHGIEYTDSIRRRFSKIINGVTAESEDNITESKTETPLYEKPKIISAMDKDGSLMTIDRYCEVYGLDRDSIRSFKLVTHTGCPFYNIVFYDNPVDVITNDTDFLDDIVKKYMTELPGEVVETLPQQKKIDRLVISDVHIGMDNTGGKNFEPIYENPKYVSDEVERRLWKMLNMVWNSGRNESIIVDNLGDFMDGLSGQTTRGGHSLPQLMSDKEAFELAVKFQMIIVDELVSMGYKSITLNNIVNDNHSFLMGYFVHSAVKKIAEAKYPGKVEYNLLEKFISHYTVGGITHILCHGKDASDMKHGMKLYLDDKITNKISQYCKDNGLFNGNLIRFCKGDLHQYVVDSSAYDFEYINYPSFAPPSLWVQTNFGNSKSGIVFEELSIEDKSVKTTVKWF